MPGPIAAYATAAAMGACVCEARTRWKDVPLSVGWALRVARTQSWSGWSGAVDCSEWKLDPVGAAAAAF